MAKWRFGGAQAAPALTPPGRHVHGAASKHARCGAIMRSTRHSSTIISARDLSENSSMSYSLPSPRGDGMQQSVIDPMARCQICSESPHIEWAECRPSVVGLGKAWPAFGLRGGGGR